MLQLQERMCVLLKTKEKTIIFFIAIPILLITLIVTFKPTFIRDIGKGCQDQYCVKCGAFRQVYYYTYFWWSSVQEIKPVESGLQFLHDSFLPACKTHNWRSYHASRGSPTFFAYRDEKVASYPKVSLSQFKYLRKDEVQKFVQSSPELANKSAHLIFEFIKVGKNENPFRDLITSISLNDPVEIEANLKKMQSQFGINALH